MIYLYIYMFIQERKDPNLVIYLIYIIKIFKDLSINLQMH